MTARGTRLEGQLVKEEGMGCEPPNAVASRSWRGKETDSRPKILQEEQSPADTLNLPSDIQTVTE